MAEYSSRMKTAATTGTVIPFRRRSPISLAQTELIELFNEMAAKASRGEIAGLMYVLTSDDEDVEDTWGIFGAFVNDPALAVDASARAYGAAKDYRLEAINAHG